MTVFELGDSKQVVVGNGRIQLWANRGCLGVQLTAEQEKALGIALWQNGRARLRKELKAKSSVDTRQR